MRSFSLRLLGLLAAVTSSAFSAERIVTLGASVTETVFALGLGDRVVARDSSSLLPEAARALPDVGYFRTIGAEGVLALRPTHVLAAQGTGPAAQVELLRGSGVVFLHLDARPSADAVLANLELLGAAFDRRAAAATLAEAVRRDLARARDLVPADAPPVRAVFLLGSEAQAVQAAFDHTAADALIELAGGRNPLDGASGYKALNAEALLALDPDVILHGSTPGSPHAGLPAWVWQTRAGRAGRVHALDLSRHLSFGPEVGKAAVEVAAWFYPPADKRIAATP